MTLSLESSKRLHELGVKVESASVWGYLGAEWMLFPEGIKPSNNFPSPTFTELWGMLPVSIEGHPLVLERCTCGPCPKAITTQIRYGTLIHYFPESPTEAAGLLLIWLAENGHIEVTA